MLRSLMGGRDLLTADVKFHHDKTLTVSWNADKQAQADVLRNRYRLTAEYFGTVIINLRHVPEQQWQLYDSVMEVAGNIIEGDLQGVKNIPVPLGGFTLVDASHAPVDKHFRVFLRQSRKGDEAVFNKTPLAEPEKYAPLSVLALLASNQRELADTEFMFFAVILTGMSRFYNEYPGAASMTGSSIEAAGFGFGFALDFYEQEGENGSH